MQDPEVGDAGSFYDDIPPHFAATEMKEVEGSTLLVPKQRRWQTGNAEIPIQKKESTREGPYTRPK